MLFCFIFKHSMPGFQRQMVVWDIPKFHGIWFIWTKWRFYTLEQRNTAQSQFKLIVYFSQSNTKTTSIVHLVCRNLKVLHKWTTGLTHNNPLYAHAKDYSWLEWYEFFSWSWIDPTNYSDWNPLEDMLGFQKDGSD